MKVAVQILCYNEESSLAAVLHNWRDIVPTISVFHTDKPWHGPELPPDYSERICDELGAEFIRLPWRSETEQRNWALGHHHRFDYVIVVDADELYTRADQNTLLATIGNPPDEEMHDNLWCYRAQHVKTYFKSPEYELNPPDSHRPIVAIDPKKALFTDCRIPSSQYQIPVDITMHHLSYLRPEARLFQKMQQFEHHDRVRADFADDYRKWEPGSDTNVRSHENEASRAVPTTMPHDIQRLLAFNSAILQILRRPVENSGLHPEK